MQPTRGGLRSRVCPAGSAAILPAPHPILCLLLPRCPAGFTCVGSFSNLLLGTSWGPDMLAEALQDPGVCTVAVVQPNFGQWWIQARALEQWRACVLLSLAMLLLC